MVWTLTLDDELAAIDADIRDARARLANAERAILDGRVVDAARHAEHRRAMQEALVELEQLRDEIAAEIEAA